MKIRSCTDSIYARASSESRLRRYENVSAVPRHLWNFTFGIFLSFVALVVGLRATAQGPGVNPDSVHYMRMALSLQEGRGFVTDVVEAFVATPFSPITLWPPGYSVLIAVTHIFEPDLARAASIVSIASFALLVGSTYFLGYRIGGECVALISGAFTVSFMPLIRTASFALSDMPFILFSMLMMLAIILYIQAEPDKFLGWLVASGLLMGLTVTIRYAGVVWIPVGLMVVLLHNVLSFSNWRIIGRQAVCFVMLSATPIFLWMWRNYSLTGHASGFDRSIGSHPLLQENLRAILNILTDDLLPPLHLGLRSLVSSTPYMLLGAIVSLFMVVVLWRYGNLARIWKGVNFIERSSSGFYSLLLNPSVLITIYMAAYLIFLVIFSSTRQFAPYDWPRYLAVIYPFLFILIARAWVYLFAQVTKGSSVSSRRFLFVCSLGLVLFPYMLQGWNFMNAAAEGQGFSVAAWRENQSVAYLGQVLEDGDTVYSNTPGAIAYLLNRPVRYLPHPSQAERFEAFLKTLPEGNSYYILAFKGELGKANPYAQLRLDADSIERMATTSPLVHKVEDFPDGTLYQVVSVSDY